MLRLPRIALAVVLVLGTACPSGPSREDRARARYHAGEAKLRASDFESAVLELRAALELDPKLVVAHHALGQAWLGLMRPRDAEASFRAALDLEPDKYLSWMGLAHALRAEGRAEDAVAALKKAAALAPESPEPHRYLGDVYAESGRVEDALSEYDAAARLGGSAGLDALERLGELFEKHGRHEDAARAYARAIAACEAEAKRWGERAAHFADEQPEVARQARAEAKALEGRTLDLRGRLGGVQVRAGRLEAAREAYRAVVAARPDDAVGWQILGAVDSALGEHETALSDYEKARRLRPDSARVFEGLGRVYLAAGREKEAAAAARTALEHLGGDDPALIADVAALLSKTGEHLQSGELYRMLLREKTPDPALWVAFAREQAALGRQGEVEKACAKAKAAGVKDLGGFPGAAAP